MTIYEDISDLSDPQLHTAIVMHLADKPMSRTSVYNLAYLVHTDLWSGEWWVKSDYGGVYSDEIDEAITSLCHIGYLSRCGCRLECTYDLIQIVKTYIDEYMTKEITVSEKATAFGGLTSLLECSPVVLKNLARTAIYCEGVKD